MSAFSWKRNTIPAPQGPRQNREEYLIARKRMVREQLIERGIKDSQILQAMLEVPRHLFVQDALRPLAYNDHPLAIGQGQTISQPYIVARMLEALQLKSEYRVLEIGTGCGYQTAVLAELVGHVDSIERISDLLLLARKNLKQLGYRNITLKLGDGTLGWAAHAPYDAIIVAAGSPQIPNPFEKQLREGGKLIIPVGDENFQELHLCIKEQSRWYATKLEGCRFVKLKGRHGFEAD